MKKFLKIILTMIIIAAMIAVTVRGVEKLKLAQNEKTLSAHGKIVIWKL